MELRAVLGTLNFLPSGMVVLVSSDSQYVRLGMTQWIHNRNRNGWKKAKKWRVANATLWQELDTAIARHRHVEFTWVKAQSGILLNEWADQLATRGVAGNSYSDNIPVPPVPPDEPESTTEL
jgi:ribonuclease HI